MTYHFLWSMSGSKSQNEEWFTMDISPRQSGTMHIQYSLTASKSIQITFDSGANWVDLDKTSKDELVRKEIICKSGDQINMRITTGSGGTVQICRCFLSN